MCNYLILRKCLVGQEPPRNLVENLELMDQVASIEVDAEPKQNPNPLSEGETRLHRIQRTGELRVGFVPDSPPFCYRNAKRNLVGLDVDLVQRLAADLDVKLRLVPYSREEVSAAFVADHFDVAIGGIASTIENFGRFHESVPYLNLHAALLVPDHRAREFQSLDAIRRAPDLRVGVVSEGHLVRTNRHRLPGIEVVQLPSAEAYLRGEGPEVDVLLTTAETGAVLSMLYPIYSVVVPDGADARVPVVLAVQMADDLDRLIDTWIRLKENDGTIQRLYAHWILGDQTNETNRRWSVIRDLLGWVD